MVHLPNLLIHSEYTLCDGGIKLQDLFTTARDKGLSSIGLADLSALHGAYDFLKLGLQYQIQPILGVELIIEYKEGEQIFPLGVIPVYAQNIQGYREIIKLVSISRSKGSQGILNWNDFLKYSDNLIVFLGHRKSFLWQACKNEIPFDQPLNLFREIFDQKRGFLIWSHQFLPDEEWVFPKFLELTKDWGELLYAPTILYLSPEHESTYYNLLAIKHGLKREEVLPLLSKGDFSLLVPERWSQRIEDYKNIAENGQLQNFLNQIEWIKPSYKVYMPRLPQCQSQDEEKVLLRHLSEEGLQKRIPHIKNWLRDKFDEKWPEYTSRLENELRVIENMNFTGYFLIVHDYVNWCHQNKIPVGPGRGSAAGSLVMYALGITNIDPLRFQLLFERFLNPERVSLPDVDVDFCQERRSEVLSYVTNRYGSDHVAQIVTFGRLKAKNALKGIARIHGWSFSKSNELSQKIGKHSSLMEAYQEEVLLRQELENSVEAREVWDEALQVEGVLNSLGIHAAGVLISDQPLHEVCPLMDLDGQTVTQFEQKAAESSGLVKFDFLGLKNLTIIKHTLDFIEAQNKVKPQIDDLSLDDPHVFSLLQEGWVWGIFQLESEGMQRLTRALKPTVFEDIIALLSLYRPGPLGSGMVDDFVDRKHGRKPTEYLFPEMESILKDTYGLIVYQEQVQQIAAILAGYTLGQADLLRRAMGKKNPIEMEKQRETFIQGIQNKYGEEAREKATTLFDLIAKFAEYGFNKSHSASYGLITYQTAYLKAHFPREFFCAQLNSDRDDTDRIMKSLRECRRLGIVILPPDINDSQELFALEGDHAIRFGLSAIKNLGSKVAKEIVEEREKRGPFSSVPEFLIRMKEQNINKRVIEKLIMAGVFQSFSPNRKELLDNYENWMVIINQKKHSHHFSLFSPTVQIQRTEDTPILPRSPTQPEILFQDFKIQSSPDLSQWAWSEKVRLEFGVDLHKHPVEYFEAEWNFLKLQNICESFQWDPKEKILIGGRLLQIDTKPISRGTKRLYWHILQVDDASGDFTFSYTSSEHTLPFKIGSLILVRLTSLKNTNRLSWSAEHIRSFDDWLKARLSLIQIQGKEKDIPAIPFQKLKTVLSHCPPGPTQVKILIHFPSTACSVHGNLIDAPVSVNTETIMELISLLPADMTLARSFL